MTENIEVKFGTENRRKIPTIGQRRKVRVNGRVETKYVKSIEVEAVKSYGEPLYYHGRYVLTNAEGMW